MFKFPSGLSVKSSSSNLKLFICDDVNREKFIKSLSPFQKNWLLDIKDETNKNSCCYLIPREDGKIFAAVKFINDDNFWNISEIANSLPVRNWELDTSFSKKITLDFIQLGWELAQYNFSFGIKNKSRKKYPKLVLPKNKISKEIIAISQGTHLVREMINLPANIMNPEKIEQIAITLKNLFSCKLKIFKNKSLKKHFPAVYHVGKSSIHKPRLIDLNWGNSGPNIIIIGKGVTFDTGGLNIKSTNGMELMKKDMGGAAHAIGLAFILMKLKINLRLRLIIPIAENSISNNSMRPSDIINTRSGLKVEIGNTDAEGRLLLADALDYSINNFSSTPDFLVDFATLTGAARIALGSECPALFCNNKKTATELMKIGKEIYDPVWELPLLDQYERYLETDFSAISSTGNAGGYGGAITAALFLRRFVGKKINWVHFDLMAWNLLSNPGRPKGGEAMGLRVSFEYIKKFLV